MLFSRQGKARGRAKGTWERDPPLLIEPNAGVFFPTLARHIIEPLWASAMAAPVPRVSEHARALIRRRARFRSEPSEPNSYWTVVDAGLSGAHASGSKLIASGSRISFVAKAASAESPNVILGASRVGLLSFSVSHSFRRWRASSGRSEKRTPARPRASAQAT